MDLSYIALLMPALMQGLWQTLKIFALTLIFSLPLGLVFTLGSISRVLPLRWLARADIWIFRGTPLMLQLFFVYYGLPFLGLTFDRFPAAVLTFVLNYAAYFAEIYRGGIQSIPRGQYEAAEVLGYSRFQTFMKIVLPQVVKRILPAMSNEIITLVKDTSLAFVLGIMEMFSQAKAIAASQVSMLPYVIAGVIYWVFNFIVEIILTRVEKRLNYYHD